MINRSSHTRLKAKEIVRLETFSDGVFAIAITLLVLELIQILHTHSEGSLKELLLSNWKSFLAFLTGFLTILICWINHHLVISQIEKTSMVFYWVNGFVLLVVTFTPLPTAILAEYIEKESAYAVAFFGFNYVMMSLAAYCLSSYALKKLVRRREASELSMLTALYRYSVLYTIVVFVVCFFSVPVAIFFYVILFFVFAFPKEFSEKLGIGKNK